MSTVILIIQIITGIILTVSVLLQNQTGGLGGAFGSSANYHTKRGVEKGLFYLTIVVAIIFTISSLVSLA